MTPIMLAPVLLAGDSLVTLEAQLGKAVAGCETGFVASVNVIPSGCERKAVKIITVSQKLFAERELKKSKKS